MGMVNWDGFRFASEWITETKECCTCREKVPVDKLLSTGMCQRCTDIENKMLERLAGNDFRFKGRNCTCDLGAMPMALTTRDIQVVNFLEETRLIMTSEQIARYFYRSQKEQSPRSIKVIASNRLKMMIKGGYVERVRKRQREANTNS